MIRTGQWVEDEIRKIPPCGDGEYCEDSDISQIIEQAEGYLKKLYSDELKEGIEGVDPREIKRTISEDDTERDAVSLKKYLRTEVSATQLTTKENDIIPGKNYKDKLWLSWR